MRFFSELQLPDEILIEILDKTDIADITNLSALNRSFRNIYKQDALWKKQLHYYYPDEYKELSKNRETALQTGAYFECFKQCYQQPFYKPGGMVNNRNPITKVDDPHQFAACQKLYRLIKQDNVNEVLKFLQAHSLYFPQTLLELFLSYKIRNYQDLFPIDWCQTSRQALMNAAFEEATNNFTPKQLTSLLKKRYLNSTVFHNLPLIFALIFNQKDTVISMIEREEYLPNQSLSDRGLTPLHITASYGHIELMKFFINKGDDVNIINNEGYTPLMHAATFGRIEALEILTEKGADLNVISPQVGNALHLCTITRKHEMMQTLIKKKLNVNIVTPFDSTPLIIAAGNSDFEGVKILIEAKADVNYCGPSRVTALSEAAEQGNWDIIKLLIKNKANINERQDRLGYIPTPLSAAARGGHLELVKYFVERAERPGIYDPTPRTILLIIKPAIIDYLRNEAPKVMAGREELSKILIAKGVNGERDLVKIITLFTWYVEQHSDLKHIALYILERLNTFKNPNNNNQQFTRAMFKEILKDSYKLEDSSNNNNALWNSDRYQNLESSHTFKAIVNYIKNNFFKEQILDETPEENDQNINSLN